MKISSEIIKCCINNSKNLLFNYKNMPVVTSKKISSTSSASSSNTAEAAAALSVAGLTSEKTKTITMAKTHLSLLSYVYLLLISLFVICCNNDLSLVSAKSLDLSSTTSTISSDITSNSNNNNNNNSNHYQMDKDTTCNSVKDLFDAININVQMNQDNKGSICGGHCCTNTTEDELKMKSTSNFENLLHHHTKSLRGILETTSSLFQTYVLELSHQSENKTLHVFSQVYRRMLPLSRQLIHDLYSSIRSHLVTTNEFELEKAIHNFFVNLFPVAYHQAVHLNNDIATGDLHQDYINCLKHTFDDLQPFGDIPKELSKNLIQSITPTTVFIDSLESGAEVLAKTDELDSMHLTSACQTHLLKINYCPGCNGITKKRTKVCYSYCLNVMRGCLAQYVGVLDNPWSNVAEAIERLVSTSIQSDAGIVNTIKGLDTKLSEAIMRAMENGPELEKKVKKTCGIPKLLPVDKLTINDRPIQQPLVKWATPPDSEIVHFLTTIERSKDFYSKIVDNLCKDDEYQQNDRDCWTGDKIGDYTQTVMSTGVDAQRYNPEVPFAQRSYPQVNKLNELVDKLIKLRSRIVNALPSNPRSYSDIQGDMARHDEEGSGGLRDDLDDDDFNNIHGSGSGDGPTLDGSGSGDGPTPTPDLTVNQPKLDTPSGSATLHNYTSSSILSSFMLLCLVLLTSTYLQVRH